jgi:hypothetical protein
MITIQPSQREFPHRLNKDGTYDSICPFCFVTIACERREENLARFERDHVCDPRRLEHFSLQRKRPGGKDSEISRFDCHAA